MKRTSKLTIVASAIISLVLFFQNAGTAQPTPREIVNGYAEAYGWAVYWNEDFAYPIMGNAAFVVVIAFWLKSQRK